MDTLDPLDQRILGLLQDDGRASYERLGAQVGLSPSAVQRRIKRLEQSGVIRGYTAHVAPTALGSTLTAYLNVRLEKNVEGGRHAPTEAFRASVRIWPEVLDCVALTGEMDYLLRVVVRDMPHYARFLTETLLRHPAVRDCRSSFVIDRIKATASVSL